MDILNLFELVLAEHSIAARERDLSQRRQLQALAQADQGGRGAILVRLCGVRACAPLRAIKLLRAHDFGDDVIGSLPYRRDVLPCPCNGASRDPHELSDYCLAGVFIRQHGSHHDASQGARAHPIFSAYSADPRFHLSREVGDLGKCRSAADGDRQRCDVPDQHLANPCRPLRQELDAHCARVAAFIDCHLPADDRL